jgi:hypothetical protein
MGVMTIAVALKVHDGFVLAADSATTITQTAPDGSQGVLNVYNHANKIVNLHKSLPIGLMTWGLGNLGQESISTLAKDLRRRLQGQEPAFADWTLNKDNYTIAAVSQQVRDFFYEDLMHPLVQSGTHLVTGLGFFIGGYSAGSQHPEGFVIWTDGITCEGPTQVLGQESGAIWWGQPEAISRLLLGFSANMETALINLGVKAEDAPAYVEQLKAQTAIHMIPAPMPIQDAIEMADFLVDATIKYTRFSPGHDTVGGPIEIAAITRHEGFRWVKRKHYYPSELNS